MVIGGTLHIIITNFDNHIERYLKDRENNELAVLEFCTNTILVEIKKPKFMKRLLTFIGSIGLKHEIMFNKKVRLVPSYEYRRGDDTLHVFSRKRK